MKIEKFIFKKLVPLLKKIFGIKDIALFRKKASKYWGKLWYHKRYTSDDLIKIMKELGMKEGSNVCIHSSMMQFYNYVGTAEELISKILTVIGSEGTLMMPAFPIKPNIGYENYIFNPQKDKTGAGYLAEVFRKYPGVLRSLNVHHSVCAIGKNAEYLIKDHTTGENCWDKTSPWYRICELDGLIFNLGLPRSYMGTFHHCVEGLLHNDFPYWSQFFTYRQIYHCRQADGSILSYSQLEGNLIRKTRKKNIFKYFTHEHWQISKISNLEIKVFYAKPALDKMLELGRKGISVYYVPSTKGFKFN